MLELEPREGGSFPRTLFGSGQRVQGRRSDAHAGESHLCGVRPETRPATWTWRQAGLAVRPAVWEQAI